MAENVIESGINCNADFPNRLETAITHKFKSVRQFSLSSGIPASSLAQYLKGVSEPTRPVLCVIANTLGVSLNWLMTGEELEKPALTTSLDVSLLTEIITLVDSHFKSEKAGNKALLTAKIYAYVIKKRATRATPSKEADSAEIIDLIEVLKSVG